MKAKAVLIMVVLAGLMGSAMAKEMTPQQQKMKTCNADAGKQALKGDARKTFMSGCLKGEAAAVETKTLTPQQQKMKTCNADAGKQALKGDARKTFMSNCLKK